jgi:hypothetical protein
MQTKVKKLKSEKYNLTIMTTPEKIPKVKKAGNPNKTLMTTPEKIPKVKKAGNPNKTPMTTPEQSIQNPPIFKIFNDEFIKIIIQNLPMKSLKCLHYVCRDITFSIRRILPSIMRLPIIRREGILNNAVLYHMPFDEFLRDIRPNLIDFPLIKNHYIQTLSQLRNQELPEEIEDQIGIENLDRVISEKRALFDIKRLALINENLNENDLRELFTLFDSGYDNNTPIIDDRSLPEFLQVSRPFLIAHPTIKQRYITDLEKTINSDRLEFLPNQPWDANDPDDPVNVENAYRTERKTSIKYRIIALNNPTFNQEQIIQEKLREEQRRHR